MDSNEVRARWERAAATAAATEGRPGRPMAPILRDDVPTFIGAPLAEEPGDLVGADVAVLGIPYEGGRPLDPVTGAPPLASDDSASYRSGADEGPAAIRRGSISCAHRQGRGLVPEAARDLVILDHLRVVDYGDVAGDQGTVEATFMGAHDKLADVFATGAVPIVFGGDHAVSIPVLQVLAGKLTGKLGVVVFDAHFDLDFEPRYAAGSQWARAFELGVLEPANFVQIGIRGVRESLAQQCVADELGHRYYTMAEVDDAGVATVAQEALELAAAGTEAVYVSLDVDVLDPACGGQKCLEPGGLSARELLRALRILARGRIAGFDICCLAPRYDPQGHLGRLAARAAVEVIAGLALQRP